MDGRDLTALPAASLLQRRHRDRARGPPAVHADERAREPRDRQLRAAPRAKRAARTLERVCALFPAVRDKLDVPAGALSGGQQQMVAIGRALMAQPRLLLLDEPSLGLSPMIVQAMFGAIREVHASGTSVLLVEQNVDRGAGDRRSRVSARGGPDRCRRHAGRGVRQPGAAARLSRCGRGSLTFLQLR